MPELEAVEAGDEVVVRYLSPPEFVKYANARERRARHEDTLHQFVAWLQLNRGLLREVTDEKIDVLVDDYLNEMEPKDV